MESKGGHELHPVLGTMLALCTTLRAIIILYSLQIYILSQTATEAYNKTSYESQDFHLSHTQNYSIQTLQTTI